MTRIGAYEAKTHFSQLLDAVEKGESVTITRRGEDVAKLVPAHEKDKQREVEEAMARIKELRKTAPRVSVEEIIEMRDEGRKTFE